MCRWICFKIRAMFWAYTHVVDSKFCALKTRTPLFLKSAPNFFILFLSFTDRSTSFPQSPPALHISSPPWRRAVSSCSASLAVATPEMMATEEPWRDQEVDCWEVLRTLKNFVSVFVLRVPLFDLIWISSPYRQQVDGICSFFDFP